MIGSGRPCYATEGECKSTAEKFCPHIPSTPTPTPTPTSTPTPIPTSIPNVVYLDLSVTGPMGAIAGILGTIGLGSAGYMYRKSRIKATKIYKKF